MFSKLKIKFTVISEGAASCRPQGIYWRIKDMDTNKLVDVLYSTRSAALKDAIHLNNN
jgi:hypothetical protein|tara:strand:- start:31 stop:204 length:174 start_codon:yes stop_codon:yes gene_type:complete